MLKIGGIFYLFLIEENDVPEVKKKFEESAEFRFEVLQTQKIENELQYVSKITKLK